MAHRHRRDDLAGISHNTTFPAADADSALRCQVAVVVRRSRSSATPRLVWQGSSTVRNRWSRSRGPEGSALR